MNTIRRITALLLATMLLLTLLPMGLTAAADTPEGYGRSILAQMDNADALLYAYDLLAEAIPNTTASVSLQHHTYKITWDELCTVYNLMLSDHPEVFWCEPTVQGSIQGDYVITAYPIYSLTGTDLTEAQAALEAAVVRLTADLEGKSDYDKSLLLHDRLAAATVYKMVGDHQSAYGALVQGTAVCAGYARAYQLLMQQVGIPTWYVTGSSISPTGQLVGHAWNLVQLDGEWYYTDVTWDDQTNYTYYAYLNNTYAQIAEDHTFGDYAAYLPDATATAHNYFVRNNLQMAEYSMEVMADVIRHYNPSRVYITGDKAAFMQEYTDHLLDLCNALNAPPGTIHYGSSSMGREVIFRLNIDHTCAYAFRTVQPTCSTDGYTAEICSYDFCHNERNRTVLPATGAHVYDHNCDADCNVCGGTRQIAGHDYYTTQLSLAMCGWDGTRVEVCRQCGATRTSTIPATGKHIYDSVCDADCNFCGTVRDVEGHIYDYDCDTDCNACGAIREAEHIYDNDNDNQCNVCGATRPAYTPGDINRDGKVNVRDLGLLQQYVNGWEVTISVEAADVNGDGKINVRDLGLLQQFLNGWDVTLK